MRWTCFYTVVACALGTVILLQPGLLLTGWGWRGAFRIAAAIVEPILGTKAERTPLEHVARPLLQTNP